MKIKVLGQPIYLLDVKGKVAVEHLSRFQLDHWMLPEDYFGSLQGNEAFIQADLACLSAGVRKGLQTAEKGIRQHFNVFGLTLQDEEQKVSQILKPLLEMGSVCLEMNPRFFPQDLYDFREKIDRLRENGVYMAIDNVGYGQSPIESLLILEPDLVKIDSRMVLGVANDIVKRRAISRLIRVIEGLDAELMALGIENEEDLRTLMDLGISIGQGYYLGRPLE